MKLLLERIGTNSKMIVLGDPSQIYSNDKNRQGLTDAISKFFIVDSSFKVEQPKFEDIGYFRFSIDDCMRSDIVKTVLKAYSSPEKISK
jgi:phosphate starvation-inducible protein PhoH